MVDKIQLLRNVGQFDSVTPPQQTAMHKLALVYAENGRGKTTLAAILRSLGTGKTDLVTERHRLGATHMPHVVINANSQTFTFENGAWSGHLPAIAVFDDHFVSQNVCSGVEIESDHRQNLHELILGAQGVALNAQLQTHVAAIEAHNRILREREAAIPAAVRGGARRIGQFGNADQRSGKTKNSSKTSQRRSRAFVRFLYAGKRSEKDIGRPARYSAGGA